MTLFDTHAHLTDVQFDDLPEVLQRARAAGVSRILIPASDVASNYDIPQVADPEQGIYYGLGIHPHDAKTWTSELEAYIREQLAQRPPGLQAIAEIGLDYYYDNSPREEQKQIFELQMDLALEYDYPVVVHCREAFGDILELLQARAAAGKLRANPGVFHCYSGSPEIAAELLKLGFYLGFDGPITFKNARRSHEVIAETPRDRIVIETDSPYLAPVPRRGKRNEPANLPYIAEKLAELWSVSLAEVAQITTANALALFEMDA